MHVRLCQSNTSFWCGKMQFEYEKKIFALKFDYF